ncbi:MAG: hypothetical protein J7J92_02980 [Candidatus Aenigmarchaeota archaeon]|nr:hypothetical protein [Candidatus Aenigmarchaeota archaeon]
MYKAYIGTQNSTAKGILKQFYIKKSDGNFTNNLIFNEGTYGFGYLEGAPYVGINESIDNSFFGLQDSPNVSIQIIENSSNTIKIEARTLYNNYNFSEMWIFIRGKPFFGSIAKTTENREKRMVNQNQFCWMIEGSSNVKMYGTDEYGNVNMYDGRYFQPIFSPISNTYSWINWQFLKENVSLGLILIYTNDISITGETGDYPYEYQIDWHLGSGTIHTPTFRGYKRELHTIYYVTRGCNNNKISEFAKESYSKSEKKIVQTPNFQAVHYLYNPDRQHSGFGSVIVNSPYIQIKQNAQWSHLENPPNNWITEIYPLMFIKQKQISGEYHFSPILYFSLNYYNGSQLFEYGNITNVGIREDNYKKEIWHYAVNNNIVYNTTFTLYNDSDKVFVSGYAKLTNSSNVGQIYVEFKPVDSEFRKIDQYTYTIDLFDNMYGNYGTTVIVKNYHKIDVVNGSLRIYFFDSVKDQYNEFEFILWNHLKHVRNKAEITSLHHKDKIYFNQHIFNLK